MNKPKQLAISKEKMDSISMFRRFYLQGDGHLASHVIWDGDRIDVFYIPEESSVRITIHFCDHFFVEDRKVSDDVFNWDKANWFLMSGIHIWDDIKSREWLYQFKDGIILYR